MRPPQRLCRLHGVERGTSNFRKEDLVQHLARKREQDSLETKKLEMADMAEKSKKRKAEEENEVTQKPLSHAPSAGPGCRVWACDLTDLGG